jgi:hypothetical protein
VQLFRKQGKLFVFGFENKRTGAKFFALKSEAKQGEFFLFFRFEVKPQISDAKRKGNTAKGSEKI